MKGYVVWLAAGVLVAGLFAYSRFTMKSPGTAGPAGGAGTSVVSMLDNAPDMCQLFPLDEVNKLTGKSFQKAETFKGNDGKAFNCEYFIDNHFIIIDLGLYEVAGQKKGLEFLDRKITTDPRITMEHFMVYSSKNPDQIMDIYLVLGPNKFVRVGKSSTAVMTNDELTALAQNMASILQGKTPYAVPQATGLSPTAAAQGNAVPLPTAQSTARSFLYLIGEKRIDSALSMMSPDMLGGDTQKQMWGVQLNSFEKLEVKSTEDSMKDTWTADTQQFKVVVDAQMKPSAASAPIPNYGWDNGENVRWIVMKKIGDKWMVNAIATGP